MNRFFYTFLLLFFTCCCAFSQDKNFIKHTVAKGETITQIAAKYKVTPYDIYQLNPDFQTGIKENDVVLIPMVLSDKPAITNKNTKATSQKTHIAKPKETLYSISRDYDVAVEDLKNSNSEALKSGLKIGQAIIIPATNPAAISDIVQKEKHVETKAIEPKPAVSNVKSENAVYHIVAPKETKFGISKKYGLTVAELEQKNPDIIANLPIGYKLIVSGSAPKGEIAKQEVEKPKPVVNEIVQQETTTTETTRTIIRSGYANYEVKPKETLFSLAQMFGISQDELITLNPSLREGVKIGMILKVPGKGSMVMVTNSNPKFNDLTKSINKTQRKELVLLIPFNASKIQGDTLKTIAMRLKKDAFLNMTLDFYAGALMAIDSAKTLGLNIDVKIYDSEESKMSSNVVNRIKNNNIQNADAVIGPFYQQYVEKAAEMLNERSVPVISPLSKEIGKSYSNLFQAMPPSDFAKCAMFDFMISKNGNIIVVSDPKKLANKELISKKYPAAKLVGLTANGALDVESLKSLLVKGQLNYVVLDSERTGMILGTTNALLNELANFQIQLVIIEPNETLDFEEISMKRLTILKMLYPSLTRENNSPEAAQFENSFKAKNKIFPSQYATRGFDVTFDTLLRLSQGTSFEASANEFKTEQIESKFEYAKKDSEGFLNKGIYIMEFQEDLSVKQVN
ncbi:MAG: LysM peptidoglycan-binding domain-containing protein [Burkholderiales bacterium]|nr:LysM peptidoglycan-binding domain-containing protein [Flavobacterium sp.]